MDSTNWDFNSKKQTIDVFFSLFCGKMYTFGKKNGRMMAARCFLTAGREEDCFKGIHENEGGKLPINALPQIVPSF